MAWAAAVALLLLPLTLGGCTAFGEEKEQTAPQMATLGPKQEVRPPADYHGPIDPQWPPSRPADLKVALEASRLYRQALASGNRPKEPAYRHEGQGLFVEEGKVGAFRFIEVVLGNNAHPDHPMPLIVLFHGRGGKPTIPRGPYDTEVPLRLFIPQGPDKLGDGYNWLATWTNSGETQLLARSLSARADELAAAIRAFRVLRPTLGKPIVVGFSQGGILTYALATRYPNDFAAAFPIAGWLPPALYPERGRAEKFPYIFAQHGATDVVVPTEKGRETVHALRRRGVHVDFREVPQVGHVVTPGMDASVRRALRRFVSGYVGGDWDDIARDERRQEQQRQKARERTPQPTAPAQAKPPAQPSPAQPSPAQASPAPAPGAPARPSPVAAPEATTKT